MSGRPKYLDALLAHLRRSPMESGELVHVEVRHDDACRIFDGEPCDCDPEVESGERIDEKYDGDR